MRVETVARGYGEAFDRSAGVKNSCGMDSICTTYKF